MCSESPDDSESEWSSLIPTVDLASKALSHTRGSASGRYRKALGKRMHGGGWVERVQPNPETTVQMFSPSGITTTRTTRCCTTRHRSTYRSLMTARRQTLQMDLQTDLFEEIDLQTDP